jgi:nucleotidyltransferase-like protein
MMPYLPSTVTAAHRDLIAIALREVQNEVGDALECAVLCGSVAAGRAGPDSDVDVVVLTRQSWTQRRTLHRAGGEIDLFLLPLSYVRAMMPAGGLDTITPMLAEGIILVDNPDGSAAQLIADAKNIMARPRPQADARTLVQYRMMIFDYLRVLSRTDDAANFTYLSARVIDWCVELSNALERRYDPPHKRRLSSLQAAQPELCALLHIALDARLTLPSRTRALWDAAHLLMGPHSESEDRISPRRDVGRSPQASGS